MVRRLRNLAIAFSFLSFFLCFGSGVSAQCISNWGYSRPITITNPAAVQTNFQVKVVVNTQALISAGKMQANGADLRFFDGSCNPVPFWIEHNTINTTTTAIWVKVPTINGNSTTTIDMYYGNTSATTLSNGAATFDFFDDFDNLNAWTSCSASVPFSITTSAGGKTGSYATTLANACTGNPEGAITNTVYGTTNGVVETRFYATSTGAGNCGPVLAGILFRGNGCNNPTYRAVVGKVGYAYSVQSAPTATSTGNSLTGVNIPNNIATDSWYRLRLRINGSDFVMNVDEGSLAPISVSSFNTSITTTHLGLSAAQPASFDWIFVRKYAPNQPGTAVGAETSYQVFQGPAGVSNGIRLWLDGTNVNNTNPATNPANGIAVSTWKDISGNGNDATTLSGQNAPVMNSAQINGKDILKFNRSSQTLGSVYEVPGVDLRSNALPTSTIFTVYRQGAKSGNEWHGVWGNDDGTFDRFFMSSFGTVLPSPDHGMISVGVPVSYVQVDSAGVTSKVRLLTAVYDHGVTNGTTIYFNANPVQTTTDNTDATAAQSDLRIGWDGDDNPFNGDIAEMVVYDRKLTDCEIKDVNRYFARKYNQSFTTASISPAPSVNICVGGSTVLTASAGTTYQWLKDGVLTGATGATYPANAAGSYQVIVTTSGCADTSAATIVSQVASRIYVDGTVASSGSGNAWGTAKKTVTEALDIANNLTCPMEIWVKTGTYYPTTGTVRDSSFRILRNNIKLYGGFFGNETLLTQRNIAANPTTLSGNIGAANDSSDNVYHVMTIVGNTGSTIDTNTIVNGFTITGGNANGNNDFFIGTSFANRNAGGGIHLTGSVNGNSSPKIEQCLFTKNAAVNGAALYSSGENGGVSSPVLRSCTFSNNGSTNAGGAYYAYSNGSTGAISPQLTDCIFNRNFSIVGGGAVELDASVATIKCMPVFNGCTFTDNTLTGGGYGGAVYLFGNDSTHASFTNCTITGNYASVFGGGVMLQNIEKSSFTSCNISSNTTKYAGGGLMLYNSSTTISNSNLNGNIALDGTNAVFGAAVVSAFSGKLRSVVISGTNFYNNKNFYAGGGIYLQDSVSLTLNNCSTLGNKSQFGGFLMNGANGPMAITGCTFSSDTATLYGGALRFTGPSTATIANSKFLNSYGYVTGAIDHGGNGAMDFSKCIFAGNKTDQFGAAMCNSQGNASFTECLFAQNRTLTTNGNGGGAIRAAANTAVTVNNSTIADNVSLSTAFPGGNSIVAEGGAAITVNNSIVWGADAIQVAGSGTITYNYSDVKGVIPTATNLSVDPYFVNPSNAVGADNLWGTSDDGLRLTPCSQAINAGSNPLIPAGLTTDLSGANRIQQTTVDMGAYESAVLPLSIVKSHTNVICKGASTGSASVAVTGGSGSYAYSWNTVPVQTTAAATNIPAGIYTVTITDQSGCSVTRADTVTEPAIAFTASISGKVDVLCKGNATGTATAVGSGGNGTLTYSWNTTPVQTTPTATGLSAGTYTVTLRDANLCTATQNVTIAEPATGITSSIAAQTNVICFGATTGSATIAASGGTGNLTYSWSPSGGNAATATGLTAGTYTVTIADASNCTRLQQVVITAPASTLTASIAAPTNVLCKGAATGSATASGSGGAGSYTYSWNTTPVQNTATASNLTAGTYVVTVRDANLCSATQSVTITEPATAVMASISSPTNVRCFGGATGTAIAAGGGGTGPYTYSWNTTPVQTTATATGLAAGTYVVTVKDAALCPATQSVTITQPTAALAAAATAPARVCAGTPLNITSSITGGTTPYTYAWTGPGAYTSTTANVAFTAAQVSMGGTYNLTVTDAANCTATASATTAVDTAAAQPGNISGVANVCANSVTTYNISAVSNATSYTWTLPSTPTGWTGSSTSTSITVTAPATAGSGVISVAAVNNCGTSVARTLNISVMNAPAQPGAITGDAAVCGGISKFYSIAPVAQAISYTWTVPTGWAAPSPSAAGSFINSAAPTTTGTGNGNITVTATNACGTSAARTLAVSVTNIPAQPAAITGTTPVCGGTAQVYKIPKVTEATGYTWTITGNGWTRATGTAADTFVNATAGTADNVISVAASNLCGTSTTRTLAVTVMNRPGVAGVISGPDSICTGGGAFTFTTGQISEATSYVWTLPTGWSGTSATQAISGTPGTGAATGTVNVTVTGSNTCGTGTTSTKVIRVNNPVTPSVTLASSGTGSTCAGTPITFTATGVNAGASPLYQWKVNNVNVGAASAANTFSSSTLNNGDVVSVVLKTSLPCATTIGGQASATLPALVISPQVIPGININATAPPDLCRDVPVTFYSNITAGGTSPTYQWWKNGAIIPGATAANYTDNALNNNDTIRVVLTSNAQCRLMDTVSSNKLGVSVSPYVAPTLTISANPGTSISSGQLVIFTASVTGGGTNPEVRWMRNARMVAGTNGLTWTTSTLRDGDMITAELVSSARCSVPYLVTSGNALRMSVSTGISSVVSSVGSVRLYPNPTTGRFTVMVKGGTLNGRRIKLEVLNVVGQVVYRSAVRPDTKDWSVDVRLEDNVANGVYMLKVGIDETEGSATTTATKEQPAVVRFELAR